MISRDEGLFSLWATKVGEIGKETEAETKAETETEREIETEIEI